ncbi:fimbrial protein [Yokenella regensburgei]|uniref:fimbrial protein n=1 Tax=Yokenella regensburgei TaxID=158877 RepID=UPI003F16DD5F
MRIKSVGFLFLFFIAIVSPERATAGTCWSETKQVTAADFINSKNTSIPGRERFTLGNVMGYCSIDNGTYYHDRVYYGGMTSSISGCYIAVSAQSPYCTLCYIDPSYSHSQTVRPYSNGVVLDCPAGHIQSLGTNTVLARGQMTFVGYDYSQYYSYLSFLLVGDVRFDGTCDVTGVDNSTVRLPSVPRAELAVGTGRYSQIFKDFTFTLKCKNQPKINLKFDSSNKMAGVTDDVLANTTIGNDDVGFQIYYKNTPLKFGDNKALMTSTQENEQLKFTAYYYRKSTGINAGTITSNAEFTFDYE